MAVLVGRVEVNFRSVRFRSFIIRVEMLCLFSRVLMWWLNLFDIKGMLKWKFGLVLGFVVVVRRGRWVERSTFAGKSFCVSRLVVFLMVVFLCFKVEYCIVF